MSKIYLNDYQEIVLKTKLPHGAQIYVDNSMNVQKRQIIDYQKALDLNLTTIDPNHHSVNGLNGFPIVDGVAFLSDNSIYGFTSSHSALINVRDKENFEVMIIRNSNYYDDKGITDPMQDRNIETF